MSRLPPAQIPRPVMSPVLGVTGPGVGYVPQVNFNWDSLPGKPATFPPAAHSHVVSDITGLQAALDGKQPAGSYVLTSNFTWANLSGKPSTFTPSAHGHVIADVSGLQTALDGKQPVGSYALTSHNHDAQYAALTHVHAISAITGLQSALDGKQPVGSYSLTGHSHVIADVSGLQTALDGKQAAGSYVTTANFNWTSLSGKPTTFTPSAHSHVIADVTGLQTALDGKQAAGSYAAASHTHNYLPLTGGTLTGGFLNVSGNTILPYVDLLTSGVTGGRNYRIRSGIEGVSNGGFSIRDLTSGTNVFAIDANGTSNTGGNRFYAGDIITHRGNNSGVIYLNQDETRFLFWDGSKYNLPSAELSVNGVDILTTLGTKVGNTGSIMIDGFKYFRSTGNTGSHNSPPLQCYSQAANGAWMSFHREGNYAVNMGLDSDNVFRIGGWSAPANLMQLDMGGNASFLGGLTLNNNINLPLRTGLVGSYNPAQTQAIWSMGSAYTLGNGGSNSYGNHYGLCWSYDPDFDGAGNNPQSKPGLSHQLLLQHYGVTQTAIGIGIWTKGSITTLGNITASGAINATGSISVDNSSGGAAKGFNVTYPGDSFSIARTGPSFGGLFGWLDANRNYVYSAGGFRMGNSSGAVEVLGSTMSVVGQGAMLNHASSSMGSGRITTSTAAPSGGADGDIWLKVAS